MVLHKTFGLADYLLVVASVACLLVLPTPAGAAEPPNGFRDLPWGASPTARLKKMTGRLDQVAMYVPRSKMKPPLFNVPVTKEAYLFAKGKFYSGSAWVDGRDDFGKIASALTETYGHPSYAGERPNVLKWTWPRSPIEIELSYDPKSSQSTVTFLNSGM